MKDVPMIAPDHLREIIRTGLLSFPVTPFDDQDRFNPKPFAAHLEWLSSYPVAGLIVAGGTGELSSLTPSAFDRGRGPGRAAGAHRLDNRPAKPLRYLGQSFCKLRPTTRKHRYLARKAAEEEEPPHG